MRANAAAKAEIVPPAAKANPTLEPPSSNEREDTFSAALTLSVNKMLDVKVERTLKFLTMLEFLTAGHSRSCETHLKALFFDRKVEGFFCRLSKPFTFTEMDELTKLEERAIAFFKFLLEVSFQRTVRVSQFQMVHNSLWPIGISVEADWMEKRSFNLFKIEIEKLV